MDGSFVSQDVFNEYKNTCETKRQVDAKERENLELKIESMRERIEGLESGQEQITKIATSVAVMSASIDNLSKEVRAQNENLQEAIKSQNDNIQKVVDGFEKRIQKNESEILDMKMNPGDTFNKLKLAGATTAIGGVIGALVAEIMKLF